MGNVHDIHEKQPHMSGPCTCLHCRHQWVGIMPVGAVALECPSCGLEHGVIKAAACPETMFRCSCGCEAFWLSPDGPMCRYCGVIQKVY